MMLNPRTIELADNLISAAFAERKAGFQDAIRDVKARMASRGLLHSGIMVSEVRRVCAQELEESGRRALDEMIRAVQVTGTEYSASLAEGMKALMHKHVSALASQLERSINHTVRSFDLLESGIGLDGARQQAKRGYDAEIDLFVADLERLAKHTLPSSGATLGWERVDRGMNAITERLVSAATEEEYQTVGLLCRETLISLAQAVFDPSVHLPSDGVTPSETDAKRMLEAYLGKELAGASNEAARRHAKAALDLANTLQHRRTATFRDAALCSEATAAVAKLLEIVSGRRKPPAKPSGPNAPRYVNVPKGYERRLNQLRHEIGRGQDT
jgi:hypothetical protein